MNRYSPEIFSDLKKLTTKPFENIEPLKLTLDQFYAFMLRRRLDQTRLKIPRGSSRPLVLFDLITTENTNPLFVYTECNIAYLPDGHITWSINEYE